MSQWVEKQKAYTQLVDTIRAQQQKFFEASGGEGPVDDFIQKGAGDGFDSMSEDDKNLYFELGGRRFDDLNEEIP